uniref:Zinc finger protein rotund n=1 Tax=Globodera pallida TaxID=36090 RepID=A0A183CE33_GLOPA
MDTQKKKQKKSSARLLADPSPIYIPRGGANSVPNPSDLAGDHQQQQQKPAVLQQHSSTANPSMFPHSLLQGFAASASSSSSAASGAVPNGAGGVVVSGISPATPSSLLQADNKPSPTGMLLSSSATASVTAAQLAAAAQMSTMTPNQQGGNREPKPFKCGHCPKAFANNSYLSQHMRIHLGIRAFGPCQFCGKKFTQLSHLQQHIRTHTGEKPYKCKYANCDKAFSQLSNLQSHSRCHQSDRPFKCNSCYKCFADEATLLEHIPKHKESKHLKASAKASLWPDAKTPKTPPAL